MMAATLPDRKYIRWRGYDYSTPANYFITVVVHRRECLLSEIADGETVYSDAGKMVAEAIENLKNRFSEIEIPFSVVMPNHIHLLLQNTNGQNISDIMRWFKSVTTNRYIHGVKERGWPPFQDTFWQRNFFDHVIRNQRAYDYIANYIIQNPLRWDYDKLNSNCKSNADDINATIKMLEP